MSTALSVLNLGCAALNGFWFYLACKRPDVYPPWYKVFAGLATVYCLIAAML